MKNLDPARAKWIRVRMGLLCGAMALGLGGFVSSAYRVQVEDSASWKETAENQRQRRLHIEPKRGGIYDRNGVLLFFAPRSQQFAVYGDVAVHERCGDAFWREIAEAMTPLLRDGKFTDAIVMAVQRVGAVLAEHFPRKPDDRNELPDAVTHS